MNSNEQTQAEEKDFPHGPPHHGHGRGRGCGPRWYLRGPIIAAFIFAKAGLVMLLWNALVPELFHGPQVEYLQALGLMILAKLLVGFGGPGGFRGRFGGPFGPPWGPGRRHWANLSPEEREKLREALRQRWR